MGSNISDLPNIDELMEYISIKAYDFGAKYEKAVGFSRTINVDIIEDKKFLDLCALIGVTPSEGYGRLIEFCNGMAQYSATQATK